MSNTLGILTAIVLALSAFFAYKNKAAYEDRIAQTQDEKTKLARSTDRFNTAVDNVNATSKQIEEAVADTARLEEETDTRKNTNEDLTLQVETKTGTVNTNKEKLGQVREMASRITDQQELANQLRQFRAEYEELGQSITAAEGRLANLTSSNNDAESRADSIRTRLETFTAGRSLPTLDTRIRSIYPTWGFVTLAAGNNSGVVANSTLNVMRGGEVIGKLLVTAVESGSASASIVPDSLTEDTVLMVGDRVVAASAEQ
ncbi:MAG TPA: hypothetical protein VLO11_11550 [Luteolibacter sp.]|nr:hypothetical protein [Luteolibacter sp.]